MSMPIFGPDISKYQDGLDAGSLPGDLVIVGSSDGAQAVNPIWDPQLEEAQAGGKELGIYHFFRNDPAEADRWSGLTVRWQDGKTVFFLDAEVDHPNLPALCLAFCQRFEALTGIRPVIYTYWNLLQKHDWSAVKAAGYMLWGAWYPLGDQRIDGYNPPARQSPPYWGEDMIMWQFTSAGYLPGWGGRLDLNIFYGDRAAWRALGAKRSTTVPRFIWPVNQGIQIRQEFGADPGGVNPSGGHTGMDFGVEIGTPIYAPAAGVIECAQWFTTDDGSDNPYWITAGGGISVVLGCDGDDAPSFVFSHLNRTDLNTGDRVAQGDVIGYSGNTGKWTTGPHLHFEAIPPGYNINSNTYGRVDPSIYCTDYKSSLTGQGDKPQPITPETDWFDMATPSELRTIVREEVELLLQQGKHLTYKNPKNGPDVWGILTGTHRDTVKIVAEQAAQRSIIDQLAKGQGTVIDYAKLDAAIEKSVQASLASGISVTADVKVGQK